MSISQKKADEVKKYHDAHGEEKTLKKYGIKQDSLRRYLAIPLDKSQPKILLFDLETSPMECYTWGIYEQHIKHGQIIKDWAILSWSAKWLCEDKIMGQKVTVKEAENREDKSIIEGLWKLLDEAHVVIAHNLRGFDLKKANARFKMNDLTPPSPYQMIDTLLEARKHFAFSCNKLDYLVQMFHMDGKIGTDMSLWKRCVTGDAKALKEMLTYNMHDVKILEDLYFELRPWIKGHPNLGLYYDDMYERCPNCGSDQLTKRGQYVTATSKYQAVRCECGAYGRYRRYGKYKLQAISK